MLSNGRLKSRPAWGAWIEINEHTKHNSAKTSRPAWGAWIEMHSMRPFAQGASSRAPHGARGLKLYLRAPPPGGISGRAPHGARGLKWRSAPGVAFTTCRAPHGARGLKYAHKHSQHINLRSRPAWGAWIEIPGSPGRPLRRPQRRAPHGARGLKSQVVLAHTQQGGGRAPHGARGLKLVPPRPKPPAGMSRPAWGAWIEMMNQPETHLPPAVAPRMGRVD